MAVYVILALTYEGRKEVLSLTVGDNESAKYRLNVLNELKNRGVKDIMIICADGLSGIKEAIAAAFPKTEYQRIVFPSDRALLKALYLATFEATKKWTRPIHNWGPATARCASCTRGDSRTKTKEHRQFLAGKLSAKSALE